MRNLLVPAEAAAPSNWQRRQRKATLWTGLQVAFVVAAAAGGAHAVGTWLPNGLYVVLGAVALGLAGAFAGRRQLAEHGRLEGLVLAALVGIGAALVPQFARMQPPGAAAPHDPNARAVARVMQVQRELQAAAGRPLRPGETALPAVAGFVPFVRGLPGGSALLANPFGGPDQAAAVAIAPRGPLRTAAELARGARSIELRAPLGHGQRPGSGPYTALTYGALVYDRDPASGQYVLYAIGQAGEQAVVVHQATGSR